MSARLDVVIVTYRSADDIRTCLASVEPALERFPDARIIVVDNGSDDDVADAVSGISDRLTLILRDDNDGFAVGCHAGAEASTASALLFLNPDAVVDASAIDTLVRTSDSHPGAGIVGGRSVLPDGGTDHQSWMGRPTMWSALCFASGASSVFPGSRVLDPESGRDWLETSRAVPVVSGGMMLVEREVWDALDGFDRSYFLYGEDVDLCLRARRAGWSPRVTREAIYSHEVGSSSAGSNRLPLVLRGRATTYRRHYPRPLGALAAQLLVAGTGLRAVGARFRPAGGRRAHPAQHWQESWRRRREWREGW
ncbi:glycosyltransferase family 2 protein [Georgenia sp. Z1491]|uniref:glycosyltransferase family 2 protein n=1 Tax=Georgenia sp. Z1491 TaxID=3416707 RepID=UPI003CEB3D26